MARRNRKKQNRKNQRNRRTDFDGAFKTMLKKAPMLAIPLINEAFDKNYAPDTAITTLSTEHYYGDRKVVDDSTLQIDNHLFHFECESKKNGNIIIRMLEYDFSIGLENIIENESGYELNFPEFCIFHLRGRHKAETLSMQINMPDGQSLIYSVKVMWMTDYTKNKIFEKNLIFLLPYYIMNYEEHFEELEADSEALDTMLDEYREILSWLEKELRVKGFTAEYCYIIELIRRIAEHLFSNSRGIQKVQKGFGDVMGGKILELETDRLIAKGVKKGRREGRKEGRKEGREEGLQEGIQEGINLTFRIMEMIKSNPTWTTAQIAGKCDCEENFVILAKEKLSI